MWRIHVYYRDDSELITHVYQYNPTPHLLQSGLNRSVRRAVAPHPVVQCNAVQGNGLSAVYRGAITPRTIVHIKQRPFYVKTLRNSGPFSNSPVPSGVPSGHGVCSWVYRVPGTHIILCWRPRGSTSMNTLAVLSLTFPRKWQDGESGYFLPNTLSFMR